MAGEVVVCSECGHSSDVHGVEGCEANPSYLRPGTMACPCPLHPSDILPMTPEQRAEFDRNRFRGQRDEPGYSPEFSATSEGLTAERDATLAIGDVPELASEWLRSRPQFCAACGVYLPNGLPCVGCTADGWYAEAAAWYAEYEEGDK